MARTLTLPVIADAPCIAGVATRAAVVVIAEQAIAMPFMCGHSVSAHVDQNHRIGGRARPVTNINLVRRGLCFSRQQPCDGHRRDATAKAFQRLAPRCASSHRS